MTEIREILFAVKVKPSVITRLQIFRLPKSRSVARDMNKLEKGKQYLYDSWRRRV